jgi:hypothetical protein
MSVLPKHDSNEAEKKWEEQDRDEFAESRSHDASKISYDFQKVTSQSCLVINGGAATAVIALLAKEKVDPAILKIVPWCLGLYAIGVAVSAFMMFSAMKRADGWNYFWYHFSYTTNEAETRANESNATWWEKAVQLSFTVAIGCFLVASIILAGVLVLAK